MVNDDAGDAKIKSMMDVSLASTCFPKTASIQTVPKSLLGVFGFGVHSHHQSLMTEFKI